MSNPARVATAMVQLADTLVRDFDLVDLLTGLAGRCVDTLGVSAAGVVLAGPGGVLRAIASSSEEMRVLELFELQSDEGPCLACFRSGVAVTHQDLATALVRWPRFAPQALAAGFAAVEALPMHHGATVLGALNLFHREPRAMSDSDVATAQAFADIATIAILQHRIAEEAHLLNRQLADALTARIVIEQAKGIVAERQDVDMEHAFRLLRNFARTSGMHLADLCRHLVDGQVDARTIRVPSDDTTKADER